MIKKFFFKRLKNYFSILMIPTLILMSFILITLTTSKVEVINSESQNALNGINDNFELITENAFYQQDMMTLNPQLSVSLRKILLFSKTNYTDYIFLNSMKALLSSASTSHPQIHSIYFYLNHFDSFFSSDKGICNLDTYYDTSWHEMYMNLPKDTRKLLVHRTIPATSETQELDALTIFQLMTYDNGVIVANIPSKTFIKNMNGLIPFEETDFFILNENKDILLSNHSDSSGYDTYQTYFLQNPDIYHSKDLKLVSINHSLQFIRTLYNENFDVHFVIMTPLRTLLQTITSNLVWPLILVIASFILVFVLSYITTRQNFSHIEYVIQLFSDAENGILPSTQPENQKIDNEYDLIMNNVIKLFLNTTFLQKQLAEQQYQKQVAELTTLQLQINPHFMVNTLQTLNFEVYKLTQKPTGINHIIDNLSDILYYSLASSNSPVSFSDEIEHVKKYVEIQKYRFPDSFLVYYEISDEVLPLPFKRLMLQPLIENSISHGIRSTIRFGYIKIRIFIRNQYVHVSVIDNGNGMSAKRLLEVKNSLFSEKSTSSIGLGNVNKRLILNYGQKSALRILSREGQGTSISFRIPLDNHLSYEK